MTDPVAEALTAVAVALRVHDEAMAMNRVHGFEMFDVSAQPAAFIAALEAQDPPFTVVPLDAARAAAPEPGLLVDIIEQAIFETDTGLEAALLASERIRAALARKEPSGE